MYISIESSYSTIAKKINEAIPLQRPINEESFRDILLYRQLTILNSVAKNTNNRHKDTLFNRHGVIHGIDDSYGTEENSLRCFNEIEYLLDLQWNCLRTTSKYINYKFNPT